MELREMKCCGLREMDRLSTHGTPEGALQSFALNTVLYTVWDPRNRINVSTPIVNFRYVIFTQARKDAFYGENFAALIRKNALGDVVETDFKVNPNSTNLLKVWVWDVDFPKVAECVKKMGPVAWERL